MKVLLLLVDSLITIIKSQMHKSQDVILIIFFEDGVENNLCN